MQLQTLDSAIRATDFLATLQQSEAQTEIRPVLPHQILLLDDSRLAIEGGPHVVSDEACRDLARLAHIPAEYFAEVEPDLRAANFTRRFPQIVPGNKRLVIVLKNNVVARVQRDELVHVPCARFVESILTEAPHDIDSNDIRVVDYSTNRCLDVSFVSRSLTTEPRVDDVVYGGVHLTVDNSGAIQLGPSTFRLICANGALARVCAGGSHRIRRGAGSNSDRRLIDSVTMFAREAWRAWEPMREGLKRLAGERLQLDAVKHLIHRLRESPFFISARTAQLVLKELEKLLPGNVTMYDLHNAITAVGTHEQDVLPRYRYRLRLGAGALARGRAGVCAACGQLVLA